MNMVNWKLLNTWILQVWRYGTRTWESVREEVGYVKYVPNLDILTVRLFNHISTFTGTNDFSWITCLCTCTCLLSRSSSFTITSDRKAANLTTTKLTFVSRVIDCVIIYEASFLKNKFPQFKAYILWYDWNHGNNKFDITISGMNNCK